MRWYRCAALAISATLLVAVALKFEPSARADIGAEWIDGVQSDLKMPSFDLDQYQLGLLRKGPSWTSMRSPEAEKIQAGHMENIGRMAGLGKLVAAGPIVDTGDLRGLFIFKASAEEATRLAAEDPAIKTGRLALMLLTWMAPKGIGATFIAEYQRDPAAKTTMTKYHIAFLRAASSPSSVQSVQQIQLEHLWNIRRMLDAGKLSAAGPFVNGGDLRGVFVFATQSMEEAREWAQADPMVKSGLVVVELHPWLVAKEVWPPVK